MTLKNVLIITISIFFLSCFGCTADQMKSLESSPAAIGMTNEIVVIADQNTWDGPVGDSLRYYFETPYLILPQPEPLFDLRHFTMQDLYDEPMRKQLRTYILLGDLQDEDSRISKEIKKDLREENVRRTKEDPSFSSTAGRSKWAQGQLVVYLWGYGEEALVNNIRKNFPAISRKVKEFDRSQIEASAYVMGTSSVVSGKVQQHMDLTLKLPLDYKVAVQDTAFMWLRKETRHLSSNILLHKVPYTDKAQLTKEGIKKIRNELGMKYITTDVEGAYMQINDVDLPMFTENVKVNGQFALEARGIWDIKNDFMGGAFISYLVLNPATNELIFMDGFVHAPGKGKRDYMQQVEYVVRSVKF